MKEFRVKVDVRNNRLIRYREELGMSPKEFAAAVGIGYHHYLSYESMRQHPIGKTGEWLQTARKIADYHGLGFDELWPQVVLDMESVSQERKIGVEEAALWGVSDATALAPQVDVAYGEVEKKVKVEGVLLTLTAREREVLRRRFGLSQKGESTLEEIAAVFSANGEWAVTRERVRQIEAKALRKLRHPSASKRLKPFVEIDAPISGPSVAYSTPHHTWFTCGHGSPRDNPFRRCLKCEPLTSEDRNLRDRQIGTWECTLDYGQKFTIPGASAGNALFGLMTIRKVDPVGCKLTPLSPQAQRSDYLDAIDNVDPLEQALSSFQQWQHQETERQDTLRKREEEYARQALEKRRQAIAPYRDGLLELGATVTPEYLVIWKCLHCFKRVTLASPWSPSGWVKADRWKEEKDTRTWCSAACFLADAEP